MAWVRIDDQAPRHDKMLKAGPAACWLWVCGIAHSQSQLTDGFISFESLPMIGVAGNVRAMAEKLVTVGLFDAADGGYRVHDYLDLNPSRADVLSKRAEDSIRKRHAESTRNPSGIHAESRAPRARIPSHPIPSHPQTPSVSVSTHAESLTDELGERVREFIEGYQALFAKHCHGAKYYNRPSVDYQKACDLCATWPNDRLLKLAEVFLASDDAFIASGPRSIPHFASRASWADGKLAEWEAKNARTA